MAKVLVAASICGWLLSGAASFSRQEPQQGQAPAFSEVIDVRLVNLEVVVTDRAGRRVAGLAPGDFELRVDGKVMPIEYFTEVRDGLAVEVGDQGAAQGAAHLAAREVPSLAPGAPVATNYLLFIDDYFSIGRDRDQVLAALAEQLSLLGEQDRMAIVRYDGRELEMLTTWSRDRAVLTETLRGARGERPRGLERAAEVRRDRLLLGQNDELIAFGVLDSELTLEERSYVERLLRQLERVVSAATATLRSFGAPPGRKVMLLLSGGWPYDPVEFVVDDPVRPITEGSLLRGEQIYSPLTDTANLLGYTLYPVDVPGLAGSFLSAEDAIAGSAAPSLRGRGFQLEVDQHQTLVFLAEQTGGEALINSQRQNVLSAPLADTRSYYWLGFTPKRAGDDKHHDIAVRVLRDGLRVRARDGYFDFSRRREVTLAVESALYFGTPPSPHPLVVRLGNAKRAGLTTMTVPLEILIPAGALTFLPGAAGVEADLEVRIAVLDEDGATTDTPVIPVRIPLAERPPDTTILRYDTSIKLRRKPHDLVIAVYDSASGTILSSAVEVEP